MHPIEMQRVSLGVVMERPARMELGGIDALRHFAAEDGTG